MSDLVEFLRARLDEDEHWAQVSKLDGRWFDRGRVLREVEAKRAMLAELTRWPFDYRPECDDPTRLFVRLLALPYSDHPDYDPEWAPMLSEYRKKHDPDKGNER